MSVFGAATPTSTNLFGGGGTSLFGTGTTAPATGTTGTGLFGATTGTTSLFGGASTNTTTANTGTTSLFGGTSTSTTGTNTLFGASTPTATTGTSLFGGATTTTNTTGTNTLFGAATPTAGTSVFGAQPNASLTTPTKTETMGVPPSFVALMQQMTEELQNRSGALYALNAFVYNRSSVPQSKLDIPAACPQELKIALKNNPDPDHLIPERVQGFDGLVARVKEQEEKAEESRKELQDAQDYLKKVEDDNTIVIEKLRSLLHNYRKLSCQLLGIIVELDKLRVSAGYACVTEKEREIKAELERIESDASDPIRVRARLDGLVKQVNDISESDESSSAMSNGDSSSSYIPPAYLQEFANHLDQEQGALQVLVDSIHKCEEMAELLRILH